MIETIEGINERRRQRTLRRQVAQQVRAQIRTHADLEQVLRRIPHPDKRRAFFESIREFLPFRVEWNAEPNEKVPELRNDDSSLSPSLPTLLRTDSDQAP